MLGPVTGDYRFWEKKAWKMGAQESDRSVPAWKLMVINLLM